METEIEGGNRRRFARDHNLALGTKLPVLRTPVATVDAITFVPRQSIRHLDHFKKLDDLVVSRTFENVTTKL